MNIEVFKIHTVFGESSDWDIVFEDSIVKDLNQIGYTGKLNNESTNLYKYIGSLSTDKIGYSLVLIKSQDYLANYHLIKVTL